MHFYIAIASVLLPLIGAASSSGPVPGFNGSDARIAWRPCSPQTGLESPRNGISSFDCGELSVPLDYTDESSSERLTLHLRRLLARKQPSMGSILLNYGGPGDSMSSSFFESAPGQQNIVGPEFDLVALQPRRVPVSAMNEMAELIVLNRGTGDTIPFTCYNDKPLDKEHHFNSHIATRNMTPDENFVGTAFVARDMERVLNALEGDKQLRFWEISYGTVLGATFAAIFPDRVERMVLDGVVNVHEYYNYQQIEFWTDTDNAFNDFCAACVAHSNTCALASKKDLTAAQVRHSILRIIAMLKNHPVTVSLGNDVVVVDHLFAKGHILHYLRNPAGWSHLAKIISSFIEKEPIPADVSALSSSSDIEGDNHLGIYCSDSSWRASRRSELTPIIQAGHRLSIFAESSDTESYVCARWPFVAKNRPDRSAFDSVLTARPVLFVGNTHDPVTPLKSAFNVSQGFPGSVVLQQNSTGHGSTSSFSYCTHRMLRQYFATGGLPKNDTICQVDVQPFAQVSSSGTAKRDLFSTTERGF